MLCDYLLHFLAVCCQKKAVECLSTEARYPKPSKLWKLCTEEIDSLRWLWSSYYVVKHYGNFHHCPYCYHHHYDEHINQDLGAWAWAWAPSWLTMRSLPAASIGFPLVDSNGFGSCNILMLIDYFDLLPKPYLPVWTASPRKPSWIS